MAETDLPSYEKAMEFKEVPPVHGQAEGVTNPAMSSPENREPPPKYDHVPRNMMHPDIPPDADIVTSGYGYANLGYYGEVRAHVAVVRQPQTVYLAPVVAQEYTPSAVGAICYSCFVFWCCNPLFGLIAFIVACCASCDRGKGAAQKITIANVISHIGLIIGIVIIITCIIIISVNS